MSTLKSDSSGNSSESVGSYSFVRDHKPRNGSCSSPDFVPDAKWWLNYHGLESGYSVDQLNVLDSDAKHFAANYLHGNGESYEDIKLIEEYSDLDSHWIGVEKIEPWWHAVDKEEITAALTSQTLSHHNKNCDRPGVQSMHAEKVSKNCKCCFDQYNDKLIDKEMKSLGKHGLPVPLLQESDRSCSSKDCNNTAEANSSDTEARNGDLNRAQLLEALCHSQTRAREAEKLAREACDDKDHVINLFFQQASCLFAYRQWLHMLQLETLCLRLRSKDSVASYAPPSIFPWVRRKRMNLRKNRSRAAKKKPEEQRCSASRCAIAFAIGLGLAGWFTRRLDYWMALSCLNSSFFIFIGWLYFT